MTREIHLLISPSKNLRWLLLFRRKHVRTSVYAQNPVRQVGHLRQTFICSGDGHEVGPEARPGAAMVHICKILQQINWQRTMNSLHLQLFDIL